MLLPGLVARVVVALGVAGWLSYCCTGILEFEPAAFHTRA